MLIPLNLVLMSDAMQQMPNPPPGGGLWDWRVGLLVVMAGSIGTLLRELRDFILGWRKDKKAKKDASEMTIVEHQESLIERQQSELSSLSTKVEALALDRRVAELERIELLSHLKYVEHVMRAAKQLPEDYADYKPTDFRAQLLKQMQEDAAASSVSKKQEAPPTTSGTEL